jgi:aspartate beta-hydroxylase
LTAHGAFNLTHLDTSFRPVPMSDIYGLMADAARNIFDRRIHTPPVLDPSHYFPDASSFEDSWQNIRDEALAVAARPQTIPKFHELMAAQKPISANDGHDWRVFVLRAYGHDVKRNLDRCPATAELIRQCPSVLSASLSYLAPGKYIPPHRGPFRGILRFHVGLSMPVGNDGRPGAIMWVDGDEHRLADGDTMLWDDTYTHEVLNTTDRVRTALLLDVWRPQMPADMAALSHIIVAGARLAAYMNEASFTH